jgi:hypothetical protein
MGNFLLIFLFFRRTAWWVRTSAPGGCSPRGLGGMSCPFKGFYLSKYGVSRMTMDRVGSPQARGLDLSLGQDVGEAP